MRRIWVRAAVAAAVVGTAGLARAQEPLLADKVDRWPTEITRRPLTLDAGMVEVWAPIQFNMAPGSVAKPTFLNPSLYLGITNFWQIGVRHFEGLCLGSASQGCANVYNDVSVDTLVSFLRTEGLQLAIGGAVNYAPFNPGTWAGEVRVVGRAGGGALALTVAPQISWGFGNRDRAARTAPIAFNLGTYDVITPEATTGNREQLSLPVTLQLQLGSNLAAFAAASLEGPIDVEKKSFGSYYTIPFGAGLVITPVKWIDVGASWTWTNLMGKNANGQSRFLAAFLAFRV